MIITYVLGTFLALAFTVLGAAKLAAVPSMRARAAHLGFSTTAYRRIGALELLAVAGIVAGLYDVRISTAAAVGLVLLLLGAVITHARNGDGFAELAPGLLLGVVAGIFVGLLLAGQA